MSFITLRRADESPTSQTIQEYCASATIPAPHYYPNQPIVPDGCKPGIAPESKSRLPRKIVVIDNLDPQYFASRINELQEQCGSKPIRQDLMSSSTRAVRLSASRRRGSLSQDILSDLQTGIVPWLERVINDASSDGERWSLQVVPEDSDAQIGFHTLTWTHPAGRRNVWYENCDDRIINVFAMEPWNHTPADLQRFRSKRGFYRSRPTVRKLFDSIMWTWEDTLWSAIFDRCRSTNARWFVLTTYENWIFGVFSESWDNVAISPTSSYDSQRPSVLQCLFFWFTSAIHQDKWDWAYKIPEISSDSGITDSLASSDLWMESNLPPDIRKMFGPTAQEQEKVFRLSRLGNIISPTQEHLPTISAPSNAMDSQRMQLDRIKFPADHPYAIYVASLQDKEVRIRNWRRGQDDFGIGSRSEDGENMVIDD